MDFQGSKVTSDGGLILVRELDERIGFGELSAQHLSGAREEHPTSARRSIPPAPFHTREGGQTRAEQHRLEGSGVALMPPTPTENLTV